MCNNIFYKNYNFISWSRTAFNISIFLCITSLIVIIIHGFNWGLDFTGGVIIEISSTQKLDINNIQDILSQSDFRNYTIQNINNSKNILIRLPLSTINNNFDKKNKTDILNILYKKISKNFFVQQINYIGPSTNKNLIYTEIIALCMSLICILIYITLRFEFRSAISTIISLIHDIIIILGILSIFSIEINSIVLAALISTIGYSLNDNIIIFDRIRENFYHIPNLNSSKIFNISLNQVLNRTIITSITTTAVLLILLIFGGSILREFSITLLLGVIIGTISSIYIASTLAFYLGSTRKHFVKNLNKKIN